MASRPVAEAGKEKAKTMKKITITVAALLSPLAAFAQGDPVPYVETIKKWNDAALGLPALPLVVAGCVAIGYAAKLMQWVPNRIIPTVVFVYGVLANLGIQPPTTVALGVRAVILGIMAGAVSIILHRKWLRSWIDVDVFPQETQETLTVTHTTTTTNPPEGDTKKE